MARVRMFGQEFTADLITDLGNGLWHAIARSHTGRTGPGTMITVKQSEILEAAAAEMPPKRLPAGTSLATGFTIVEDSPLKTIQSTSPLAPASPLSSDKSAGLSDLEAAMETERKTLPSPADLIVQHRQNLRQQQAVSVPPGPTQRPAGRQQDHQK